MFYSKENSIVGRVAITTLAGEMPVTCVILQNQKDSVVVMMTGVSLYLSFFSTTHRADKLPRHGCKEIQIHTDSYRIIDFLRL